MAKLIHDVDCGSLVMVIFIDRVCNSLSTGIGPSTLCFFQQSAKILALIMYLMITSSYRTYQRKGRHRAQVILTPTGSPFGPFNFALMTSP